MFQSLGVNNPRWNAWRRGFAVGFAALITAMNVMFPIAVLTGIVDADDNPDCTHARRRDRQLHRVRATRRSRE